jgi:hypothetical protein
VAGVSKLPEQQLGELPKERCKGFIIHATHTMIVTWISREVGITCAFASNRESGSVIRAL